MRNDEDLRTDVIDELQWEPSVDATKIDVSVSDGIVTLKGSTPSYYEKYSAEDAAARILGVAGVRNEIDVEVTETYRRSDEDIREAAESNLTWNTLVPEDRVTVKVDDGMVTLEGDVEWNYQKMAASDAVSLLPGVIGVTNNIAVNPSTGAENPRDKIKKALKRDALVDADKVDVKVEDNTAILEGKVSSWPEKRRSGSTAWSTPGITSVQNNLTVSQRA